MEGVEDRRYLFPETCQEEEDQQPSARTVNETSPLLLNRIREQNRAGRPRVHRRAPRLLATLLWSTVCITLFLLALYWAVLPFVAQHVLDETTLSLSFLNITEPSTDGKTLKIYVLGTLVAKKWPLLPAIEAVTQPAELHAFDNQGTTLGKFWMPHLSVRIADEGETFEISSVMTITDEDALARFGEQLVNKKLVYWGMTGRVDIFLFDGMVRIRNLLLRKSVPLQGMGGLQNTTLVSYDLPSNHPLGGIKLSVVTLLENPSNVAMDIPFGLSIAIDLPNDIRLAIMDSGGPVSIGPGVNALTLSGRILPYIGNVEKLVTISEFFSSAVTGKSSPVVVRGLGTMSGTPRWLNKSMSALTVHIEMPPQPKMDLVDSLKVKSLGMDFTAETAYSPMTTGKVRVGILPPFGFPLRVTSLAQSLQFYDSAETTTKAKTDVINRTRNGRRPFAHIETPFTDILSQTPSADSRAMMIVAGLPPAPFQIYANAKDEFANFMTLTFESEVKSLLISGTTSARVMTAVGLIELKDVELEQFVTLAGMSSLTSVPSNITTMDVYDSTATSILIRSAIKIYSPADVSASLGAISLDLYYCPDTCQLLGNVKSNKMDITKGWNDVSVYGSIHGSQKYSEEWSGVDAPVRQFLGGYITGLPLNLTVRGSEKSTDIPSIAPLLSRLTLTQAVPALPSDLIDGLRFHTVSRKCSFTMTNDLQVPIALIALRANATFHNHTVGRFHIDLEDVDDNLTFTGLSSMTDNDRDVGLIDDPVLTEDETGSVTKPKHRRKKHYDGRAFIVPPNTTTDSPRWSVAVPISGAGYELIKEILKTGGYLNLTISVRCYVGIGQWRGWIEGEWKDRESHVVLDY